MVKVIEAYMEVTQSHVLAPMLVLVMVVRKVRGHLTAKGLLTTSVLVVAVRGDLAATTAKVSIQVRKLAVTELETAVYTAAVEGGREPHGAAVTARLVEYALFGVSVKMVLHDAFRTNTALKNLR